MPWSKPKPEGAYLAVYTATLRHCQALGDGSWQDLLSQGVLVNSREADRLCREGRVWAKGYLKSHGLEAWRVSFRWLRWGQVQMRVTPRDADVPALDQVLSELAQK